MKKTTGFYLPVRVDAAPVAATGFAGGVLLTKAAEVTGLTAALRDGLQPWRKATAAHHPGKVVTDLAVTLALGGDCLADAAVIRSEPDLYGRVGSEATISRTITALAADTDKVPRHTRRPRHHWLAPTPQPDSWGQSDLSNAPSVPTTRKPGQWNRHLTASDIAVDCHTHPAKSTKDRRSRRPITSPSGPMKFRGQVEHRPWDCSLGWVA